MLIVGRKEGTGLWIGNDIYVGIHSIKGSHVRVRIDAPPSVGIFRDELWAKTPESQQPPQPEESLRVLVIDVESGYAQSTVRALRMAGATPVGPLCSLDEVNRWIERGPRLAAEEPELLLVDTGGRGLGGATLIRNLRSHPMFATVPIVALSRAESHTFIDQCMEAGANAFIAKPEVLAELMIAIRRVVDFWSTSLQGQHVAAATPPPAYMPLPEASAKDRSKQAKSRRKAG